MTTAIVVDDEQHIVEYVQAKLATLWPQLNIVGTANNGRTALAAARELNPDIAFLDIHMPGMTGLELAEALPPACKIVFITAYDQFALAAFEQAAVDYLLKPIQDERLRQTVTRLQQRAHTDANERQNLIAAIKQALPQKQDRYLQWIRAGLSDTTQLIAVEEVIYFQADQKYTTVVTPTGEHLIRRSIKDLEVQLDPAQFWRVHRGIIVRVEQIVKATRDLRGRYTLTLRDSADTLRSSASYSHHFKQM